MLQPDYKIFEMNKRLQQRTEDSDNLWWDAFANEFFDDEAQLTLTFCLEDGPKRYSERADTGHNTILTDLCFSRGENSHTEVLQEYI